MTLLLPAASSSAILPDGASLGRLTRSPRRQRPPGFGAGYDAKTLVYDCFRADGDTVLLVGPPAMNLAGAWEAARVTALPSGTPLSAERHESQSVMLVELRGAPRDTTVVRLDFAGQTFDLTVQLSSADLVAGRKVMFTMSRDNDLAWIAEWARYHAKIQGVDAVILFDNGSTRYAVAELEATLTAVPGLAAVAVLSWPHTYGVPDPAVLNNPYYTHFLQIASMSVALRRYAARAAGLLNCDIDELVATPRGETIFDRLAASRRGLIVMRGQFVEAVTQDGAAVPPTHADFPFRLLDAAARREAQRKWALDPRRPWVQRANVFPYMHWIEGRPPFSKTTSADVFYWHFRGIHTGWKDDRANTSATALEQLERDPALASAMHALHRG